MNKFPYQLGNILLIVMLLSFMSCIKENEGKFHTVINGHILDYYTLEPIPNVFVSIKDGLAATGFIIIDPMATNLSDTAYTDQNGAFQVELHDHSYNVILGIYVDGYLLERYFLEDNSQWHSFPPGVYPNYTIRLKPIDHE